jgi:hypothetical protein
MNLMADEHGPVILLDDGEISSGLGGCGLIVPTQEKAERVADEIPKTRCQVP